MRDRLLPEPVRRDAYAVAAAGAALATAAVVGLYGLAQALLNPGPEARFVAFYDVVVVVVCVAVAHLVRRGAVGTRARQEAAILVILALLATGILIESLLEASREARLTSHILMVLVASGVVVRSWRAHAAFLAVTTVVWLGLHSAGDGYEVLWLPTFLVAAGISAALHLFVGSLYRVVLDQQRDAEDRARSDGLTGLLNRKGVEEEIQRLAAVARRTGSPMWCAFLDVDRFKLVNDTLGHDVGDRLLVAVARAVTSQSREIDAVGRWGGDEFVVVGLGPAPDTVGIQRRINAALATAAGSAELGGPATVTVGVAATPALPDGAAVGDMLRAADLDMYRRRARG